MDPVYISVSEQSAYNLSKNLFETLGIYIISALIYATFPIYHFIANNEIHLIIPVLFPFTDLVTVNGIVINMANQLFTGSIGVCGTLGIEVAVCMIKNTFGAISSAACYSIGELVTAFNESTRFSNRIVEIHFRNIIIQLQDFDRYTFSLKQKLMKF